MLVQTGDLIAPGRLLGNKKIKIAASVRQANFFKKSLPKVFPKLITKILNFLLFELAPSFKWVLQRTCALICIWVLERHFPLKTGYLTESQSLNWSNTVLYKKTTLLYCLQVLFKHLLQQGALPANMKNIAENLIRLKVNKKLLEQKLSVESGKIFTLKDISNLVTRINPTEKRNDLQTIINNLENQFGKFQEINVCKLL